MKRSLLAPLFLLLFTGFLSLSAACAQDFDVNACVAKYRDYDNSINRGFGYVPTRDSGYLAWGESYILNDYHMLYKVTGDHYWLDKMVMHIDLMICTMARGVDNVDVRRYSDAETEAFVNESIQRAGGVDMTRKDSFGYPLWHSDYPGWNTTRFSSAMARVTESRSAMASLKPEPAIIKDLEMAKQVTGHTYEVYFGDERHYGVSDQTANVITEKWVEYNPGDIINRIPGVQLLVEWNPAKADRFIVKTVEQKPLQFLVHDGMALYPVARFIETIQSDAALQAAYGRKASAYKKAFMGIFERKWEPYWVSFPNSAGTYKSTESPAEPRQGWYLPLNQSNAMGRAFLVMQSENCANDSFARDRATKLALYFKNYLHPAERSWFWNYWECGEAVPNIYPEDSGHAVIDVGFALEAYHRNIVFTRDDMNRFVNTLLDRMWDGNMADPHFGHRINVRGGNGWDNPHYGRHWIELCEFNGQVFDVCASWFRKTGESPLYIPQLLYARQINELRKSAEKK